MARPVAAVLALAVALCLAVSASAQRGMVHPLTNIPDGHKDVSTAFRFVSDDYGDSLPFGEPVTLLCAFYNGASTPMNVSMIMGSVNHPFQFDFFFKNFTPRGINATVGPDQEITFQYRLIVDDQNLDADSEYRLALTVFYDDDTEAFANTFFNDTRKFYYPPTETDMKAVAGYVAFLGVTALVAYFVMGGSGKSSSSGSVVVGDGDDDFTGGREHMRGAGKPSSARRRNRGSKNSN